MVIVFEKDRTVVLNKDGSIKRILGIAEEAFIEEDEINCKNIEASASLTIEEVV